MYELQKNFFFIFFYFFIFLFFLRKAFTTGIHNDI